MEASYPTRLVLAFRGGGICAYPECARVLTYESVAGADSADTYTGEAAHIRGESQRRLDTTPA